VGLRRSQGAAYNGRLGYVKRVLSNGRVSVVLDTLESVWAGGAASEGGAGVGGAGRWGGSHGGKEISVPRDNVELEDAMRGRWGEGRERDAVPKSDMKLFKQW